MNMDFVVSRLYREGAGRHVLCAPLKSKPYKIGRKMGRIGDVACFRIEHSSFDVMERRFQLCEIIPVENVDLDAELTLAIKNILGPQEGIMMLPHGQNAVLSQMSAQIK
jgi:hypothetical protein